MEKPALTELGDINSPHFEFIFWDIYDPLVHCVPFDIGTREPPKLSDSVIPTPNPEPILIDRSNKGIIDLSTDSDVSPAAQAATWLRSRKSLSPAIDSDKELPQSVNPASVRLGPSSLQELSETQFSTSASGFATTIPESHQNLDNANGLPYNDMSPAEILASIPKYSSDIIPTLPADADAKSELFPDENVAISTLHSPNINSKQVDSSQSGDRMRDSNVTASILNISKSHAKTDEPYNSGNGTKLLISSTPKSISSHAYSSEHSANISSFSCYSDRPVEQESSRVIRLQDGNPSHEPNDGTQHSVADEKEPLGYSCFCGGVDDDMMIACEGDHGENELWFHYHCAGVDVIPEDRWYCKDCRKTMMAPPRAIKRPQSSSRSNLERIGVSNNQRKKALPWSKEEDLACINAVQEAIREKGRMGIEKLAPFIVNKLRAHGFERSPAAVKLQWNRRLRADAQLDERRLANPHKMRTSVMKSKSLKRKDVDMNDFPAVKRHRSRVEVAECQAGSSSQASEYWDEKLLERNYNLIKQLHQSPVT